MGFVDTVARRHRKKKTTTNDSNIPIIISNYSMDAFVGMHDHRDERARASQLPIQFCVLQFNFHNSSRIAHIAQSIDCASARACTLSAHSTPTVSMMILFRSIFFFVASFIIAHVCDRLQLASLPTICLHKTKGRR